MWLVFQAVYVRQGEGDCDIIVVKNLPESVCVCVCLCVCVCVECRGKISVRELDKPFRGCLYMFRDAVKAYHVTSAGFTTRLL